MSYLLTFRQVYLLMPMDHCATLTHGKIDNIALHTDSNHQAAKSFTAHRPTSVGY